LRGMLRGGHSVIRRRKRSQFVRRLLKRSDVYGGRAFVASTTMTEDWSDDRSKQDVVQRSLGEYPLRNKSPKGRAGDFCQWSNRWARSWRDGVGVGVPSFCRFLVLLE
jgi:hypothetical protein